MIPSDLRGEPADTIFEVGMQLRDPELKARLLDVVWEANRNHRAAADSILAYVESARNLFDPDEWVHCAKRYERALRLAAMLRRDDLRDAINRRDRGGRIAARWTRPAVFDCQACVALAGIWF